MKLSEKGKNIVISHYKYEKTLFSEIPNESPPDNESFPDGTGPLEPEEMLILNCAEEILPGQFLCSPPDVDPETQQPRGCQKETLKAPNAIECQALPGIQCIGNMINKEIF